MNFALGANTQSQHATTADDMLRQIRELQPLLSGNADRARVLRCASRSSAPMSRLRAPRR